MLKIRKLQVIVPFSLIVMLSFLSACGSPHISGAASYQPPFLPLSFSIDTTGAISIQGNLSLVTPLGTFSISASVSNQLASEADKLILVIRHKDNKVIVDTAYKIQTGQDEVSVVTNGRTTIDVTQHKVFIDASHGSIQTIQIKSNNSDGFIPANGGDWSGNQHISNTTSNQAPALAVWNNALYMAFVDSNNNNDLTVISSTDGLNWSNDLTVGQSSGNTPALVVWHNRLYLFFVGADMGHGLQFVSSTDGRTWTDGQYTGEASSQTPAIVVWNDTLYMALVSDDPFSTNIEFTSSNDGVNWAANQTIHGVESNQAPALAVWNNILYLASVDPNNNNNLTIVSSTDGQNWTGRQYIEQASSHAPALAIWNDVLYMVFTANDSSNRLLLVSCEDGLNWTGYRYIGQASSQAPALATWNSLFYTAFTANDPSNHILLVLSQR